MATGGAPRLVDPARPRRWRARASLAASGGPKKKRCKTNRAPRRRRATGQARHPARFAIGVGVLPRHANLSRFATRRRYPPITQAMSNNGQFRRFLPAEIEPCGKVAESIFRKTPSDFYINSVMPLPSKWRTDSLLFLWRINIGVRGGPHRIFRWLQKQSMRNGRSITSLDMPIPGPCPTLRGRGDPLSTRFGIRFGIQIISMQDHVNIPVFPSECRMGTDRYKWLQLWYLRQDESAATITSEDSFDP